MSQKIIGSVFLLLVRAPRYETDTAGDHNKHAAHCMAVPLALGTSSCLLVQGQTGFNNLWLKLVKYSFVKHCKDGRISGIIYIVAVIVTETIK